MRRLYEPAQIDLLGALQGKSRIVMFSDRSAKKHPRWMPPSRVFFVLMSEYTKLVYYQLFTSQVGIPARI